MTDSLDLVVLVLVIVGAIAIDYFGPTRALALKAAANAGPDEANQDAPKRSLQFYASALAIVTLSWMFVSMCVLAVPIKHL